MTTDRNPIEELDYIAGVLFAQEKLLTSALGTLLAAWLVEKSNLHQLFLELSSDYQDQVDYPEFGVGYRETLQKMQEAISGF